MINKETKENNWKIWPRKSSNRGVQKNMETVQSVSTLIESKILGLARSSALGSCAAPLRLALLQAIFLHVIAICQQFERSHLKY